MKIAINEAAKSVNKKIVDAGYECYLVGGAVRDLVLNRETDDWDFTTNAKPEEILELFEDSFYDNNFGTVMVSGKHVKRQFSLGEVIEDDNVIDITTYRSEHGYSDSRRPDSVTWGDSLEEDLKRRDFTINAMAMKIISYDKESEVELVDMYSGEEDLQRRLIRAVGDADLRFTEDALRMLRAIRIASQLKFEIEDNTYLAIKNNFELIKKISWERIGAEFMKIMASDHPALGVEKIVESGLGSHIIPEIIQGKGVSQAGHHIYDVYEHSIESLRSCPSSDPVVRLATLLHDVAKPDTMKDRGEGKEITFYNHEVLGARMAKEIASRLRLSKKDQERIFILVRWHMFTYSKEMTDAAIRRFITNVGKDNIHDMMMLRVGDRIGGGSKPTSWRLNEFQKRIGEQMFKPLSINDLAIDGKDVMELLGIKPGPRVGEILKRLFDEVIEDSEKNNREYLAKRVKEMGNESI